MRNWKLFVLAIGLTEIISPIRAHAAYSPEEYREALKIADQEVQRRSPLRTHSWGTHQTIPTYRVGDRWSVAVIRSDSSAMRMTDDLSQLRARASGAMIFNYEVTQVIESWKSYVVIRVTQRDAVDDSFESLELRISPKGKQLEKSYRLKGNKKSVSVSPDSVRSPLTSIESLPLDFPNLTQARVSVPHRLPQLPLALSSTLSARGDELGARGLGNAQWFESEDFFGRPVQALWRRGELFPAYLKTPQGVAVLLSKESSR